MPSQLSIDSLKALMGGPSGRPRVQPMDDYGFAGSVPTQGELDSPFEREQTFRAGRAEQRDRNALQRVQATNAGVTEYNRPDVTGVRQQEEESALRKLIMPLQVKGEYDVRAAQAQANTQAQRDERLFGNRMTAQNDAQGAVDARSAAAQKSIALRQGLAAQIATKRALLSKAGGGGVMGMLGIGGPSEKDKLMQEIEALSGQMAQSDTPENPETPAAAPSANRLTRKLKNGGVAYSDDGGASWYQE